VDDTFLAMCDMPRIYVPRAVQDRPHSRNLAQLKLEEEDAARRRERQPAPGYGRDEPVKDVVQSALPFDPTGLSPIPFEVFPLDHRQHVPAPELHLEVALIADLVDEEASQFLHADALTQMPTQIIAIDLKTMAYEEVCFAILQAFGFNEYVPGVPEMYVDTMLAGWLNPATGLKQTCMVYDYNWESNIVPFIISHPMSEISLAFGVAVAEELDGENIAHDSGYGAIDPALLN
jgi:hypothetical protein